MTLTASLTNRIFLGTAALVVVAIGVAVVRVNVSVSARSETELQRGLTDAVTLVEASTRAQVDRFERDARLIASLPVLRGAVATGDPPTVQPIAEQYQSLLAGDVIVVLDTNGRVLAGAGRHGTDPESVARLLAARPVGDAGSWFSSFPGGALLMTAVPMEFLGTLVVGVGLDSAVVERLQGMTRSDIALVTGPDVIVSTLGPADAAALAEHRRHGGGADVRLGRSEFATRELRLASAGVGGADLVAIVLRSRTEQVAFLRSLQTEIAATGVVAVLVATLVGYAIARTVTRPLRAVTATMREMAATGSLAGEVPPPGRWDDEDARLLSTTFRQMTASIDRYQRDVAQRERLAALGRLSAVVAHEVRNPLMIITGAVRTLRRSQGATDDSIAQRDVEVLLMADSIEEEVRRLNRVVSDVLDFAKPLVFARTESDLVDIARSAAAAVTSNPDDVPVVVESRTSSLPLVTDVERVRTVLVNLLTNSQQAVRERCGTGSPTPVVIKVAAIPTGGARVTVTDRGVGVPPSELPRIFEPFYTTKRTGSGLGLAITRNVIEGLGGTVSMQSDVDKGTTVDVTFPG